MSKVESLKIQTCVLKVNIHCDGCQKKVKKILHKIEGVYQTSVDPEEGKVTVSGVVDPATIIKKLNKAGKRAELWGAKAAVANQFQKLSLDGGGKGQPKDAGGKGQKGGVGGGAGGASGGSKDAKVAMPQLTPQQLQMLQQLQMKGMKLPPPFMDAKMPFPAAAPAKDPKAVKINLPPEDDLEDDVGSEFDDFDDDEEDFDDEEGLDVDDIYGDPRMMMMKSMGMPPPNASGGDKKGGGCGNEVPVQIKGNANNGGGKQNQGAGGNGNGNGGGKNGGGGQPNSAKGGVAPNVGNQPGQAKKGGAGAGGGAPAAGVGGPMGGMPMLPQQAMMRPNMMGGAGFPGMGQMGGPMSHPGHMGIMHGQHGGVQGMPAGGVPAAGFYQGAGAGGMPSGPEMLQASAAAGNPMAQQQYMALMQQQQMMMNGHGHAYGPGGAGAAGYPPPPPMGYGYGYGYGRPPMPPYPMPPHPNAEPYNYFSDENPNSCSVM